MTRSVKLLSSLSSVVILAFFLSSSAQAGPAGLGLILGDTTGVSFKYYMSKHTAFDLALGSPLGYYVYPGISVHGDLMWTDMVTPVEEGRWMYYLGGGLGMASGQDMRNGEVDLRILTGMEYFFHRSKFAIFGELTPCVVFNYSPALSLHAALGGRFYF
jgi:hypothetical protein